ncbi:MULTISPECIES: NAD(P)H-dependent oxidoreductase [Niastella]|uniref:NAD(P)H-dependent oxidoreductase n=1 Tax=Niastella soli TaxID=2821487 RepID=A0ABS3YY76_9BACT|nr:NAD(P)H-dependent oxidoreductase [Niastella soli]MBO9202881.1 NAD(P)H-dependent oxidoreductase [Niastella soli]
MRKILIIFAHPVLEKSRVHKRLLHHIPHLDGITVNDLYENYPDFDIDVTREQQLLLAHDIIIWQHPLYWYSAPAMLKQWQDLVLEHGWAYGKDGYALRGKKVFNVISSGSSLQSYQREGYQHCTITEVLKPFERTAELCRMTYLPPFWVSGTHKLEMPQINEYGKRYNQLLQLLRQENLKDEELMQASCLNDLIEISQNNLA